MAHNPYQLGVPVPIDDSTEWRNERRERGLRWPRRIEEYWNVRDRNLNTPDGEALERRILDAYGSDDCIALDSRWFVTDDRDLFLEMYRLLRIDFVADFRSGLFFMDMFAGHESLMQQLFDLTGQPCPKICGGDSAEAYVDTGLGMFKSSQSPVVRIGSGTPVPDYFRQWKHRVEHM